METQLASYFLSIPSGDISINAKKYYAIGISSPIGKLLLGKKLGDVVRFRESVFEVTSIF